MVKCTGCGTEYDTYCCPKCNLLPIRQSDEEAQIARLTRERDRYREALTPFARYYHPSQSRCGWRVLSRKLMPDEDPTGLGDEIGLTADDFLAARAALETKP